MSGLSYRAELVGLLRLGASSGLSRLFLEAKARDYLADSHDPLEILASDVEREVARKNLLRYLKKTIDSTGVVE